MGFKIVKEVSVSVCEDYLGYIVDSSIPRGARLNKKESVSSEDIHVHDYPVLMANTV